MQWTLKHDSLLTSCDTSYDLTVTGCDNHNFYLVDTRIGNIVDTSKGKKGKMRERERKCIISTF